MCEKIDNSKIEDIPRDELFTGFIGRISGTHVPFFELPEVDCPDCGYGPCRGYTTYCQGKAG